MNRRVSDARPGANGHRAPAAPIAPSHAKLIEEAAELRRLASAFVRAHRRVGYVRPGSPEAIYLNALTWAMEHMELLYSIAARGEGTLVVDVEHDAQGFGRPKLTLRPPPARVVSLDEYRARRAAG